MNVFNDAGEPALLEKVDTGSFTRYGDALVFPLSDYGIDLIQQDGLYLMPLQTLSDILMPNVGLGCLYFNGQCIILTTDVSTCGDLYYAAPTGERSAALVEYGMEQDYNEAYRYFCLSAEGGYPAGMFAVGECYYLGTGMEKDLEAAAEWYQKALNAGFEPRDEEETEHINELVPGREAAAGAAPGTD